MYVVDLNKLLNKNDLGLAKMQMPLTLPPGAVLGNLRFIKFQFKSDELTNLGEATQDGCKYSNMLYQLVWDAGSLKQEKDKFCKTLYNVYQFFKKAIKQKGVQGEKTEMDKNFPE